MLFVWLLLVNDGLIDYLAARDYNAYDLQALFSLLKIMKVPSSPKQPEKTPSQRLLQVIGMLHPFLVKKMIS